ncbi:UNVERIFIED_CONTAM: hypothetical protein H355_003438 [Colinus virginianus]|nr:hypothetical protein H355_003438 [Colinus virginianus]
MNNDLHLGDALGGGGFNDLDLVDGKPLPPHIADSGLIAGVTSPIISAFVILVVGSIAAYTAYKNNKLCFKPRGRATV